MLTNNSKKNIYYTYIIVIIIFFIMTFIYIVGNDNTFTVSVTKMPSSTAVMIFVLITLLLLYINLTTGILFLILIFAILKLDIISYPILDRFEQSNSAANIPVDSDKSKVIDNIIKQLKQQNPNMNIDDNYYNYLFDKYFSGDNLIDRLTAKKSCRVVSDLESGFIIPYNLIEEERIKISRSDRL